MDKKIENIIQLIKNSELDQTIKDILIRDLQSEGLTDFLREQIISYCLEGIKKTTLEIEEAKKILSQHNQQNQQQPAV